MAHRSFSCFCCNLQFVPSIEKNIINFSLLQTVVRKTSIDGTTCRLQQKQLKPQWAIKFSFGFFGQKASIKVANAYSSGCLVMDILYIYLAQVIPYQKISLMLAWECVTFDFHKKIKTRKIVFSGPFNKIIEHQSRNQQDCIKFQTIVFIVNCKWNS